MEIIKTEMFVGNLENYKKVEKMVNMLQIKFSHVYEKFKGLMRENIPEKYSESFIKKMYDIIGDTAKTEDQVRKLGKDVIDLIDGKIKKKPTLP